MSLNTEPEDFCSSFSTVELLPKAPEDLCCPFNMKNMKESLAIAERLASAAMLTSPAARRRLKARNVEIMGMNVDPKFVPPKELLMYLVRMGSFSSTPKMENDDKADDDIIPIVSKKRTRESLLEYCCSELCTADRPSLIQRKIKNVDNVNSDQPPIRILQWNVLSQSLGVTSDCFVECPKEALIWKYRRFHMLQEIIQHDPDIICLQEVDHFGLLEAALGSIGYEGKFMPKPDSPCVYLADNNGPDGCALFYKTSRLELLTVQTRVLEVWKVPSNQVSIAMILKDLTTGKEFCASTTHLKAKKGALLATLRDNQGKDLLEWLASVAGGRPVVLTGDFNADPIEPVYHTTTNHRLHLRSAYCDDAGEPAYTTWKIRPQGEVCRTIDYIFHSSNSRVVSVLELPTEEQLGPSRAPNMTYPSDHFSLLANIIF